LFSIVLQAMGPGLVTDDALRGGLLYDDWMTVTETTVAGDNPLWARQTNNTRSGSATWSCTECHGWDYKGDGGTYGSGSHFTGFPGVIDVSRALSESALAEILRGGRDWQHDFSAYLSDEDIDALAAFLRDGVANIAEVIDYGTGGTKGSFDSTNGQRRYDQSCAACHGDDGMGLDMGTPGSPVYIGTLAMENPWRYVHRTRFGQPGVPSMPATDGRGWTLDDVKDVLGYSQTLPTQ
jgi:thiosulfate dehydrogenase